MPAYRVDEMVGEQVVLTHDMHAPRPMSAAIAATGREVAFKTAQEECIRVIDLLKGGWFCFAYAGRDRRSTIDRQLVEAAKQRRDSAYTKPPRNTL